MDNGFDGTANVAEQLANLLLPAGYALFGKVDLRIVCEEIQEASPIGGNPCVVVRHCVFGECHRRFPPSLVMSSATNLPSARISSLSFFIHLFNSRSR